MIYVEWLARGLDAPMAEGFLWGDSAMIAVPQFMGEMDRRYGVAGNNWLEIRNFLCHFLEYKLSQNKC